MIVLLCLSCQSKSEREDDLIELPVNGYVEPCSSTITNSQIIPCIQSAALTADDKAILDKYISKYTAFSLDTKELTDYLQGNGGAGRIQLSIDEEFDWTIDLVINDLRAPNFEQIYSTGDGTFEIEKPFLVDTFKGKTSDGRDVRFTIDENYFAGYIFDAIMGDCLIVSIKEFINIAEGFTQFQKEIGFITFCTRDVMPVEVEEIEVRPYENTSNVVIN